jgi:hypothetical protein
VKPTERHALYLLGTGTPTGLKQRWWEGSSFERDMCLACTYKWVVVITPSMSTLEPRRGRLMVSPGWEAPLGGVNPGNRPYPNKQAPEGRTFFAIELRGSPLRGSIIIVHPLPRAHGDLRGRLPPWANHNTPLRGSSPRRQRMSCELLRGAEHVHYIPLGVVTIDS